MSASPSPGLAFRRRVGGRVKPGHDTTETQGPIIDWSLCPDVERIPGKVNGVWLVKKTRIPVEAILDNADDFTPEELAAEIYEGLPIAVPSASSRSPAAP